MVVPDEDVELLEGVVLVEPEVPLVAVEPVLVLVLVLVLVAASATRAPPAIRPLVRAPMAITFRRRNLMVTAPFVGVTYSTHLEEQGHLAGRSCASVPTCIKPR